MQVARKRLASPSTQSPLTVHLKPSPCRPPDQNTPRFNAPRVNGSFEKLCECPCGPSDPSPDLSPDPLYKYLRTKVDFCVADGREGRQIQDARLRQSNKLCFWRPLYLGLRRFMWVHVDLRLFMGKIRNLGYKVFTGKICVFFIISGQLITL